MPRPISLAQQTIAAGRSSVFDDRPYDGASTTRMEKGARGRLRLGARRYLCPAVPKRFPYNARAFCRTTRPKTPDRERPVGPAMLSARAKPGTGRASAPVAKFRSGGGSVQEGSSGYDSALRRRARKGDDEPSRCVFDAHSRTRPRGFRSLVYGIEAAIRSGPVDVRSRKRRPRDGESSARGMVPGR